MMHASCLLSTRWLTHLDHTRGLRVNQQHRSVVQDSARDWGDDNVTRRPSPSASVTRVRETSGNSRRKAGKSRQLPKGSMSKHSSERRTDRRSQRGQL